MAVISAYAAYSKDKLLRKSSSSGGVFSLLANYVIEQGGVVYGVAMDAQCSYAEFVRVSNYEMLLRLRGSKYLQAKLGKTFVSVKSDLEKNTLVLFTGTGCQINGLLGYLGKKYPNLVCVDVICHGVPSAKLWGKYKDYCEKKNGRKVIDVNFRCKENGWEDFGIEKKEDAFLYTFTSKSDDPYMQFFLRDYCLRPSCYSCKAKERKLSDITIADFWKIEQVMPDMKDDLGVSLVITRTEAGKAMYSAISEKLVMSTVDYALAIQGNKSEYCSVTMPVERKSFYSDLDRMDFSALVDKYLCKTLKGKIRRKLSSVIGSKWLDKIRGGGQ